ncbi:FadR family transcriptional regulator [Leucobacter chromiireducens subsp. solipictus]|uniref:FadR family transcriptional regulator n=1 Tax=Leucobacter chromiireducens subsp. solipictus TaxID=398235 RepID=A0ABS1SDS2_9MICO|nr:FadR family transcriptional regulator [Leucobacter chromiireducens subsp. solipictus]
MDWGSMSRGETLSVPDRLSVDLERLILEGELTPGEKLPAERELAQLLRVSRVSIREALRELENRGLIDRRPGRGTIILAPGEVSKASDDVIEAFASMRTELTDIMELRAIVEPPIARITATRAQPRDVIQLEELVKSMEVDVTKERYAELDRAFHQAIAQYTHNPLLSLINEQIANQIAPSRASRYQTKARRQASSVAHRRIYEAIAARDGARAEDEARAHVYDISREIARASENNSTVRGHNLG